MVAGAEVFQVNIHILSSIRSKGKIMRLSYSVEIDFTLYHQTDHSPWIEIKPKKSSSKTIFLSHWHERHYNSLVSTKSNKSNV